MALSGNNDKYGINIRQWCREHEEYIERHKDDADPERLLAWHQEKLRCLQHERLVHLVVTLMTVIIELFVIGLVFFLPEGNVYAAVFMLGMLILIAVYLRHYFFLENTVQHWYRIEEELYRRTEEKGQE
jgi:hypothetical protein